jgi:hypothetical protein
MSTAVRVTRFVPILILYASSDSNPQPEQWMLFNDDQVTPVSEAEVLGVDAYLLFYNLRYLSTASP